MEQQQAEKVRAMTAETLVSHDMDVQFAGKPPMLQYAQHALKKAKMGPLPFILGFRKWNRGIGRITFEEYVQYGLYRPDMPDADKARFISESLHWPVTHKVCDMSWQAVTEDKWLLHRMLSGTGLPMPDILAVIDTSERLYPGTQVLRNAAQLAGFLKERGDHPLFAKQNRGIASFGTCIVDAVDGERVKLRGSDWMSAGDLLEKTIGDQAYILQDIVHNHADIEAFTPNLATIRMCVLKDDDGVRMPFCVLKLPSRHQIADNFWRPGNLACDVDPATGCILDARSQTPMDTEQHTHHPETGAALAGTYLPHWDRVRELVQQCAPIFGPIRYQSMDIAITPSGPMLIEVNTGGSFHLPQIASGRGLLTDEVTDFFKRSGYAFG